MLAYNSTVNQIPVRPSPFSLLIPISIDLHGLQVYCKPLCMQYRWQTKLIIVQEFRILQCRQLRRRRDIFRSARPEEISPPSPRSAESFYDPIADTAPHMPTTPRALSTAKPPLYRYHAGGKRGELVPGADTTVAVLKKMDGHL